MSGGSCNNGSFPNFNIDPYYSCSALLHSPPIMYYEMDDGFLINNEDQQLKVIQQTDELIMKTSDHDFHTSSVQIKASNSISNVPPAVLEQAAADAASANYKKIYADSSSHFVDGRGLVEANTGAAAAAANSVPAAASASARRVVSKRDRHSKINTAQGPRDRRVRLSLDVAREFFKLQDMLGFDKPSRTVHWLLTQSETAIQNLTVGETRKESRSPRSFSNKDSASSISECHCGDGQLDESANALVSGHDDEITTAIDRQAVVSAPSQQHQHQSPPAAAGNYKDKHRRARQKQSTSRSTPLSISTTELANESRKKARYRARKRTEEKMESRRRILLQYDQQKQVGIGGAAEGMIMNNTNIDEVVMMQQQYHENNLQLEYYTCGPLESKIAVEEYSGGSVSQNMKKLPLGGEVQSAESIDQTSQSEKVHRGLCGGSSLALAENWSPLAAFRCPPHNDENYQVPACPVTKLQYHGSSWNDYGHPNLY